MVDNNGSLERVEEWGDTLKDISSTLEERQIQDAIESYSEVPRCFEELEERARAATPKMIGSYIEDVILRPKCYPDLLWRSGKRFVVLDCEIPTRRLDVSKSLSRGFGTRVGLTNRLFGHWIPVELLVLFAWPLAPILIAGVIFVANLGFMVKHVTYLHENYPGIFIRRHDEIHLPSLRALFNELEEVRLKPRLEIKLDSEKYLLYITLTCEYSKVFERAVL